MRGQVLSQINMKLVIVSLENIKSRVINQSISIRKFYPILFYHLKKPFYYLYQTILQYLQHPKTLFLLKYYFFNLSLLFLSNRHFFSFRIWHESIFLGFPTVFFFLNLLHRFNTQPPPPPHTHTHLDERIKEIRYKTQTMTYNQRQPGKPTSNE